MPEPSPLVVPPLPLPILSLGVTGHRANNGDFVAHEDRIAAVMAQIFTAIAAATGSGAGPVQVRLHSLLADGTDQLAAHGALSRGWELVAPLPFGRALNQAINAHPASPADARLLLAGKPARAAETATRAGAIAALAAQARVFELADADAAIAALYLAMVDAPTDVAAAQRYASAASRRVALAGRVMIEQSDLMIAVWDGASRDAVGGTGHTLASALVAGASVVLIDARHPEQWRLVSDLEALDQPVDQPPDPDDRNAQLRAAIAAALHPADEGAAPLALAPSAWRATSSPLFHAYRRVEALFGGGGRPWRSLRRGAAAAVGRCLKCQPHRRAGTRSGGASGRLRATSAWAPCAAHAARADAVSAGAFSRLGGVAPGDVGAGVPTARAACQCAACGARRARRAAAFAHRRGR